MFASPVSHAADYGVKALSALDKNQFSLAHQYIMRADDPAARKLYDWMRFKNKDAQIQFSEIRRFIKDNPKWPHQYVLRERAEQEMPEAMPAEDVLAWFKDYPPRTADGMDRYMQALLATGQEGKLRGYIGQWWANTNMDVKDQKRLYRVYKQYIPLSAHRKRLDRALYRGEFASARALARALGDGYPELAAARIALAQKQQGVNALINKIPRHLQSDTGLLYERLKWRRRNNLDMRAMEILHRPPPADQMVNPKNWWRERHIIIRRQLEKGKYESAYLLAAGHQQKNALGFAQAEWLAGWISLSFLNKPEQAYEHFSTLAAGVKTPVSKARAHYWAGLAAKASNMDGQASNMFAQAVKYQTTFYGQAAAAQTGAEQAMFHAAAPKLSAQDKRALRKHDFIKAANLCAKAKMRKCTSLFLHRFVSAEATPKAYRFAAEYAVKLGHYHDTVQISKNASRQGMFLSAQAYPMVLDKVSGRSQGVEIALIHALIRQESMFDQYAQSPVGARGLMQLMPSTAKQVARDMGMNYKVKWLTERPEYNITLGARYLSEMLARFDGNYVLAIAAYNAGPGRVEKWLDLFGHPSGDNVSLRDWIELIPIYETRNYVQRVLEATHVYRLLMKERYQIAQNELRQ